MRAKPLFVMLLVGMTYAASMRAECEIYALRIEGVAGGSEFEIDGVFKHLNRSLSRDSDPAMELSFWTIATNRPARHGNLAFATHTAMFGSAKPADAARWRLEKSIGEIIPVENSANYFTLGSGTESKQIQIAGGSIRFQFDGVRGEVTGEIDLLGRLPNGDAVGYRGWFTAGNSTNTGDGPCGRSGN